MKKLALITGATLGIGRQLSCLHAHEGGDLILVARNLSRLEKWKKEIEDHFHNTVIIYSCNLSKAEEVQKLITELIEKKYPIEYIINNSGKINYGDFLLKSWEEHNEILELNLITPIYITYHLIKALGNNYPEKEIHILNVSSLASFVIGAYDSLYFTTKTALRIWGMSLREELRLKYPNIKLSTLCPGLTDTDLVTQSEVKYVKAFGGKKANPAEVAYIGYKGMLKGKELIFVNFFDRLKITLARLLPLNWQIRSVSKAMQGKK